MMGMSQKKYRSRYLLRIVLCVAAVTVSAVLAMGAKNEKPGSSVTVVKGQTDIMSVDKEFREIRFTATVMKDCAKASVCDWGSRGQAFIGSKGGKAEAFFIITTDVNRFDINKAVSDTGIHAKRTLKDKSETARIGLKPTTVKDDYLDGDPMLVVIRYTKGKETVELALEELIDEKIIVEGKEVIKPYTPHFVYHGTAEVLQYASGCIVCPSGCYGGIIADNSVPLLTTTSQFKVNWDKMPAPGTKVEVVLKSIYGPVRKTSK